MYAVWNAIGDLAMAGVERFKELEQRYIPGTEALHRASDGFGEEPAAIH